ncbi:MAG: hypothetical protein JSW39_19660 [Desulfobacterales bacterium]|nr:MAG: hypothetical protein JSW39_19660 [Desulfobacterales bacterium]
MGEISRNIFSAKTTFFIALPILTFYLVGCSIWTKKGIHHFGPILFRYQTPDSGSAYVCETVHLPVWLEGGRRWGIGVGLKEDLLALPQVIDDESSETSNRRQLFSKKTLSAFVDPKPRKWHLSLLYFRADYPHGFGERFLAQKIYGVRISGDDKTYSLSAGFSRVTFMRPAGGGLYIFHFNSNRPMETEFRVWHDSENIDIPLKLFMKKETP